LIVASTLGRILAIDPGGGDRTLLFPPGNPAVIPQYITMLSMDMDPERKHAHVLSSSGAICSIELAAGVLELVSGSDPYFPNSMGAGHDASAMTRQDGAHPRHWNLSGIVNRISRRALVPGGASQPGVRLGEKYRSGANHAMSTWRLPDRWSRLWAA
jgi:hypothetical protein